MITLAKEEKKTLKHYEFYGTWYWGCWAESEEEAILEYNNAGDDELNIDGYHEIIVGEEIKI